jgi:hypothetical protein
MLRATAANLCTSSGRVSPPEVVKNKAQFLQIFRSLPSAPTAVKLALLRQCLPEEIMGASTETLGLSLLAKDTELSLLSLLARDRQSRHGQTSDDTPSSSSSGSILMMDSLSESTRRTVLLSSASLTVDNKPNPRRKRRGADLRSSRYAALRENTRRNVICSSSATASLFMAGLTTLAAETILVDDTIVEGAF